MTDTGQTMVVPLAAAKILVYPEAKLQLNYFWQRDVIGADPFNPQQVIPPEPFYLGLRVTNVGEGNADNLTITSAQPQIVENEKGLLINFQIIGSQVENQPGTDSLSVGLGLVQPGQTVTADWALLSSLQGRFDDFTASFTHDDDGGSLRTSLIDSVNIHELIHVVHLGQTVDNNVPSFLSDDLANPNDNNNMPTTLYIGDHSGSVPVSLGTDAQFTGNTLAANMQQGWSYIEVADPAPGQKLVSVTRSDGKVIPIDGMVWRTDRTFPDNQPGSFQQYLIHVFDFNSTGSYTFNFAPNNGQPPHTRRSKIAGHVQTTAVSSVNVTFNEPINLADLHHSRDHSPARNGAPVTLSGVTIADDGGGTYSHQWAGALDRHGRQLHPAR